jgi:L-ribulokinase
MVRVAEERQETWLKHYGGKISSEWLPAKALSILEEALEIYNEALVILEGADWVAWQLTGVLAHNACGAGYKGLWHKGEGFPSREYLAALNPLFADLYTKLPGKVLPPGERLGGLNAVWARRLGLLEGTSLSVPIIDAHSATLGAGVTGAGILFMIMGTSTCHMLMSEQEVFVRGISGVVEDGIARGLFGYEAGQVAVGDIFAWFVENCVPSEYLREAEARNLSIHDLLSIKASASLPGQSGLLALDWWNGNRTPLVDADLSGLFIGCTLASKPEELYRTLIESTAFGTRWIIETFETQGISINSIVAGGGLVKNDLLMQIYADITGREFKVSGSTQVSALGAALLASVAAGSENGGHSNLHQAAACMVPKPEKTFEPNAQNKKTYDILYKEYLRLGRYFSEENHVMKTLAGLRKLP